MSVTVSVIRDKSGTYPNGYDKAVPNDTRPVGAVTVFPRTLQEREGVQIHHPSFGYLVVDETMDSFVDKLNSINCVGCNSGGGASLSNWDYFTANGTDSTFSLSDVPLPGSDVRVFHTGVLLDPSLHSIFNTQSLLLNFTPASGDVIAVNYDTALGSNGGGPVEWNDVQNKPSSFTPSAHTHAILDVNGLRNELDTMQGQIDNGGGGGVSVAQEAGPVPIPFGDVYNKYEWASTADFTAVGGTVAATVNGSAIRITGTGGGFGETIQFGGFTGLQDYKITLRYKMIVAGFGIGIGRRSFNENTDGKFEVLAQYDTDPAGSASLYIRGNDGAGFNNKASIAGAAPVVAGNVYEVTLEQKGAAFITTLRNISTGAPVSVLATTYDSDYPVASALPNRGKFALYYFGGTVEVQSLRVYSNAVKHAKIMTVGDSKTVAIFATDHESSWPQLVKEYYGDVVVNAGGYESTSDVIAKLPQIISFSPRRVVLNIGSNDKRRGISYAVWQANYDNIVTQLTAAGIDVYHLLQLNESSLTFTDYNTHISTTYPANRIINAGTVTLSADGIHPAESAQRGIADAVIAKVGVINSVPTGLLKGQLNVVHFGAKLDGKMLTNVVTSNANTTITSQGAGFNSRDVGKVIAVVGPSINGPHLVTTITAVTSPSTVTVANPATGVSVNGYAIYGTDDTVAWQAVLDAATEQRGTEILAPAGTSVVAGSLKTGNGYNSQINIPLNPLGADQSYSILLRGVGSASSPAWWQYAPVTGGTIIFSTAQVVTGTRPAVIGSTTDFPILNAVGNAIRFDVDGIVFRALPNPNLAMVDCKTVAAGNCRASYFDVLARIDQLSAAPTNANGIGYIQSGINSLVGSSCEDNYFTGFHTSIVPGECGYLNNNFVLGGVWAYRMDFMNYPPTFGLVINSWVQRGMHWVGKSDAQIQQYQTEHWDGGVQIGGVTVGFPWMATVADFSTTNTTHWLGKCQSFYGVQAGVGRVNQLLTQNCPYAIIVPGSVIQEVNTSITDTPINLSAGAFVAVPNSTMTLQGGGDWIVSVRALVDFAAATGAADVELRLMNKTNNYVIGQHIVRLGQLSNLNEKVSTSFEFQFRIGGIEQIELAVYGAVPSGTVTLIGASYAGGSGTVMRVRPL